MKGRAVPYAGGNGNHRTVGQTAHNAGQRAFHTRNGNNYGSPHYLIHMGQQPVYAGNSHIVQPYHFISVYFSGQRRFLGYRNIRGSACGDYNLTDPVRRGHFTNNTDFSRLPVIELMLLPDFISRFR